MMSSDKLFPSWAALTGKTRLPTVGRLVAHIDCLLHMECDVFVVYVCLGREYIITGPCQAGAVASSTGPTTGRAAGRLQDKQT